MNRTWNSEVKVEIPSVVTNFSAAYVAVNEGTREKQFNDSSVR